MCFSIKHEKAVSSSCHIGLWMVCGHYKRLKDEDPIIPRLLGCLRSLYLGMSCGIAQVSSDSVLEFLLAFLFSFSGPVILCGIQAAIRSKG